MTRFGVITAPVVLAALCGFGSVERSAYAVDTVPSPAVTPSPMKSGGSLAPVLPPEGLPTAPPPDAIKPVVPQARIDTPELEPAAARPHGGGS